MEKGTSLWKDAWHRLAHNRAAIVSLFVQINDYDMSILYQTISG